jgi:uncharacterized protein YbjT (DUF2867 family)
MPLLQVIFTIYAREIIFYVYYTLTHTTHTHTDTDAPIAIVGARGKTGKLIVKDLLSMGKKVRALSYQPFTFDSKDLTGLDAGLLTYAVGDVTKPETLPAAVRGASAVVFASSASKKGGDAKAVDCLGVENIARCVCVLVFLGVCVFSPPFFLCSAPFRS